MECFHRWEPFRIQAVHTLSCNSVTLASSPQRPEPETSDLISERIKFPLVACFVAFVVRRRFLREPAFDRTGMSNRSIVIGLIDKTCARTCVSSRRWPCDSIVSRSVGIIAFRRFPQIRSAASQRTVRASRTASSQIRRPIGRLFRIAPIKESATS